MLAAIAAVSVATPFLTIHYCAALVRLAQHRADRAGAARGRRRRRCCCCAASPTGSDYRPFLLSLVLFALSYAGLGISMYPYIVPQSITIWQAAAPANSQLFMLVGVAVLIPLILGYTGWAYWVFRGKVRPGSGYH